MSKHNKSQQTRPAASTALLTVEQPKVEATEATVAVAEVKVMEPKVLASKMGISPKRLRAMLRAGHPRAAEVKGKKWEIPADLAKKVEADYKAKKLAASAEKTARIQKELKGEA